MANITYILVGVEFVVKEFVRGSMPYLFLPSSGNARITLFRPEWYIKLSIFMSQGDERNGMPRRIHLRCPVGYCIIIGMGMGHLHVHRRPQHHLPGEMVVM